MIENSQNKNTNKFGSKKLNGMGVWGEGIDENNLSAMD
jgi:hypothetical protein